MTILFKSTQNEKHNQLKLAALSWLEIVLVLSVTMLALFIYLRTLTPGLLGGDGGEFQTLPYLWGHSHPTGYPVYLTAARLFAFLPTGNLAYRINLFSAVMGSVTVAGVYVAGRILTQHKLIPALGAILLAISPTLWSQATIAEVYTSGAALFAWIVVFLLWWQSTGNKRALFMSGLLGGLAIGVHMSVVFIAPAMGLFLLLPHQKKGDNKTNSHSLRSKLQPPLLGAATGLAITILLFLLMNWNNPTANYFTSVIEPSYSAWGLEADQIDGSIERLMFGWRGQQFQSFLWQGDVFSRQAADYWENLPDELSIQLVAMAMLGIVALLVRRWQMAVLLIVALAIQLAVFFQYEIWDLYVFYIPSYVLITLLAIAGAGSIVDVLADLLSNKVPKHAVLEPVLVLLMVWFVLSGLQTKLTAASKHEVAFSFDEYPEYQEHMEGIAAAVTASLPPNAILFTDWEMLYPYYHTAVLQNGRDDLMFIETFPADDQSEIADSALEFIRAHYESRPIYFMERHLELTNAGVEFSPKRLGPLMAVRVSQLQSE